MKVAEMNSTRIPSLLLKYACEILVGISERNVLTCMAIITVLIR